MFCFFLDNLPEEEQEVEKERREEKEKKELRKATAVVVWQESRVWGSAPWDRVLSCCDETCRVQPQEFAWLGEWLSWESVCLASMGS